MDALRSISTLDSTATSGAQPLRGVARHANSANCRVQPPAQGRGAPCGWLLIAQDRIDSGVVPITHDFLATMLGTDRPSVTVAAGLLQARQILEYKRGAVKIVNRKRLEQFACECYEVVRQYDGDFS